MENFEFYNPVKLVFGAGEVKRVGSEAKALGKNALLVSYENHDFMKPLLENVTAQLEAEGISVTQFYKVVANPLMSTVREGAELCRNNEIDFIVAVGGGSVIDTTKFVAAGVNYEGDIWNMVISRHDADVSVPPETALPTMMISTIPATGSEMNCGAVVTNEKTMEKSYLFAPCVYPKVSILDPELTTSLPSYQTACGIADAISHVLEVYLNGADEAPLQQRIMEGTVSTLMDYAPKVLEKPNDLFARTQIQWAACVAWNGWTLPGTTFSSPMHMIAHPLSARYNLTHGATLAIIMPAFMKFTYKACPKLYAMFGEKMLGLKNINTDPETAALKGIATFEKFLEGLNIETRLSQCGIKEEDLGELVEDCVRVYFSADGTLAARNPLTKEDVKSILRLAL